MNYVMENFISNNERDRNFDFYVCATSLVTAGMVTKDIQFNLFFALIIVGAFIKSVTKKN